MCRYCQTPEPVEENKCFECGVQEVSRWVEGEIWPRSDCTAAWVALGLNSQADFGLVLPASGVSAFLLSCTSAGKGRYLTGFLF